MSRFEGLNKLQLQAELRQLEGIPQKFCTEELQEIRIRLDNILEDEKQAEIARDERKHGEAIIAARRSRLASILSVSAAVVSAGAAAVSAYYAFSDHSHVSAPTAQRNTPTPTPQTQGTSSTATMLTPAPSATTTATALAQPTSTP